MPNSSTGDTETPSIYSPSCPPEDERSMWERVEMDVDHNGVRMIAPNIQQAPTPPAELCISEPSESHLPVQQDIKHMEVDHAGIVSELPTPMSAAGDKHDEHEIAVLPSTNLGSSSIGQDFSSVRLLPTSLSSFLRAGSRFHGTQQSERQVYDVQVEIKHVDMRESFLCGYLRIQGLTADHPTLTTYFEGEIIGSKYSFLTQHQDWGVDDKVDLQHWAKFAAFRPFQKLAKKGCLHVPNLAQRDNIFMRWKEHFLVPDHRVRTLNGASFEGFYYICFNQIKGTVSGIYFHARSEKFQQLELKHIEDRGCFAAMEFR